MILDNDLKFSDAQDIKATTGSTNYVDLGAHYVYDSTSDFGTGTPDIGEGPSILQLNCKVEDTAIDGTSLQIDLYHHTASGVSTIITSGAVLMTKTITIGAGQADGATLIRDLLPQGTVNRYLAVKYTDVSTDISQGAVTTWIADPSETPK